jgi:hypothetical protein
MSQCRPDLFFAAGFRVGLAEGEVDGAADLLVEQDVLDEALDVVVGADAEFAEPARALVHVQHLEQVVLVLGGGGLHHQALAEHQADAVDLAPALAHREVVADAAFRRILHRAGEDFAAGHVVRGDGRDERAALDGHAQVGAGADDAHLVRAAQAGDEFLLLALLRLPRGDGVVEVQQVGAEHEVGEIGQAHLRVLRVRLGGEEGERPFLREQHAPHRAARLGEAGHAHRDRWRRARACWGCP